jgi:hypothetical protein
MRDHEEHKQHEVKASLMEQLLSILSDDRIEMLA